MVGPMRQMPAGSRIAKMSKTFEMSDTINRIAGY